MAATFSTIQDLLDRQHSKQGKRRYSGEAITGFGLIEPESPFDRWKAPAEAALADLYAASYYAELMIDGWHGVVPYDIGEELARISRSVDEMQSRLRAWDGSRGDE